MESLLNDSSYDNPILNKSSSDAHSNDKNKKISRYESIEKDSYRSEKTFTKSSDSLRTKYSDDSTSFSKRDCPPPELLARNRFSQHEENRSYNYSSKNMPHPDSHTKYQQFSYSDKNIKKIWSPKVEEFQESSLYPGHHQNLSILNFRQIIDFKSSNCFKSSMEEARRLHKFIEEGNIGFEVYDKRYENLCLQQREFENFASSSKMKLTTHNNSDNDKYMMESIIRNIEKESEIFMQFFPAYGVRSQLLGEIEKSQMTIVSADSAYCFNVVLPLLLYNEYLNHSIIACESTEILSHVLKKRIDNFFPTIRAEDEKSFLRILEVLSVEMLLGRMSDTGFVSESNFCVISCIPLKRSVVMDIFLTRLRDLLAIQKHSKLILLLSKYDNHEKFHNYFSQKVTCSILKVPDLIFPVTTMWKSILSSVEDDFIGDVVSTVISIHVLNQKGDIIAFLPSASDVLSVYEKVDRELHNNQFDNLVLFCIIDAKETEESVPSIKKYLVEEQKFSSMRKVFLAINGTEGIFIPSIKFVIDCGVQKECLFDKKNDINTFQPSFISRDRAKLRKELAGINDGGICYRIYCKKSYKKMCSKEYAEIFCINPIHSIVKVFQHSPYRPEEVQFVETLPSDIQTDTLKILKDTGAIDEYSRLTPFGEKMTKLPFSTKYSRFILWALQWGVAYEAIIIVAFFTQQTQIFLEPKDADHQRSIDAVKLNFNVLDSDSLTYLNIFKTGKKNNFRRVWCNEHHIDHTALKNIRLKINEICDVIHNCLNEEIKKDFSDQNDSNCLIEILHRSFRNNLCIFTGHPRSGYQILATHQLALVHPSSFLFSKEEYPRFIIYDKLTKEKRNFISNLTCIPFDLLMKFMQDGTLKFSQSECFEEKLDKRVIEPIGEKVISQVLLKNDGRRVRELEENIKKDVGAKIVLIEPLLGKGCVVVYAFPCDIYNCFQILKEMLENQTQALINEEETKVIELKKGQNSTFVQIKWVKGAQTESFTHVLVDSQADSNINLQSNSETASQSTQSSAINYSLKLSWPRRTCTGEGFLKLNSREDFRRARRLGSLSIKIAENEVYVEVDRREDNQLHICDIAPNVTEEDLIDTFTRLLPECEFTIELQYSPPFETSTEELCQMKEQIESNCLTETNLVHFEVKVLKPEPSASFMEACINVFEERCLEIEAKNISAIRVNGMKLSCKPLYFSNIKCSTNIYKALRNCIDDELLRFKFELEKRSKNWFFKMVPSKDTASEDINIELSCNDIEVMKALQLMINRLLDGVKLDRNNLTSIHKLFCHGGHVFLKSVDKTRNVYVLENFETKTIRLYGSVENCEYVKQCINVFLKDTENEVAKTITLSKDSQNRIILKEIIKAFGVNLESFIELYKLRSAVLDIKSCSLMLCGKTDDVQEAENRIKELSASINPTNICDYSSDEEMCGLCKCPAINLTFRLELCGHLYCSGCIEYLVEKADLPLQCAADCRRDIILGDIKFVLDEDEAKIKNLVDKSLKYYLEINHDKIFHCPAADCSYFIFKSELKENKWQCPLCQNFICISCAVIFHEGLTCDIYKGSKDDPDYSFKVYQKATGASKHCPHCNTAIEKKEGCNHMTCTICHGHFCWLCREGYKTGDEVYRHIQQAHRGQLFT